MVLWRSHVQSKLFKESKIQERQLALYLQEQAARCAWRQESVVFLLESVRLGSKSQLSYLLTV